VSLLFTLIQILFVKHGHNSSWDIVNFGENSRTYQVIVEKMQLLPDDAITKKMMITSLPVPVEPSSSLDPADKNNLQLDEPGPSTITDVTVSSLETVDRDHKVSGSTTLSVDISQKKRRGGRSGKGNVKKAKVVVNSDDDKHTAKQMKKRAPVQSDDDIIMD
jgi:hypothetical protein